MTLHVQFLTILLMFCSGLILGTLFDVFRVLSRELRLPKWMLPLVDILYWIVATILVFRLLIYSNEGQVRVFIYLGMLIGICFYYAFLSLWTVRLVMLLIRIIVTIYHIICKTVFFVFIKPLIGLYRLIVLFLSFFLAVAIFLYKIVIQLLYPVWRLILWIIRPLRKFLIVPGWLSAWVKKLTGFFRRLF